MSIDKGHACVQTTQQHLQTDLSVLPMATGSPGENEDIFEVAMAGVTNTRGHSMKSSTGRIGKGHARIETTQQHLQTDLSVLTMTTGSPGENENIFEAAMAGMTNTREVRAWNEHWQRRCARRDYLTESADGPLCPPHDYRLAW
jgi:hypothetical protein